MSELIHTKDKGTMIDYKKDLRFLKCGKCGFKVLKTEIYDNYNKGIVELPVK